MFLVHVLSNHNKVDIKIYLYLSVMKQFLFSLKRLCSLIERATLSHLSQLYSEHILLHIIPLSQATPWTVFPFCPSSIVYDLRHIQFSGLVTV